MITLAHLSDIHLAPLPPVGWRELLNKRLLGYINWRLHREPRLVHGGLEAMVRHLHDQRPDAVAVTGDLVNLGLEAEARAARQWLEALGQSDRIAVAPGNHDAYLPASLAYAQTHWGGYMQGYTLDETPFPFVRRFGEMAVVACSSATASAPGLAIGHFDAGQADRLATLLTALGAAGLFRVVLIHHPPHAEARDWKRGLRGAERFRSTIAQCGAELILHGHTHRSSINAVVGPAGAVPVVGVAAAAAAQSARTADDPARYNLFTIMRAGRGWSCVMREFGFQRLGTDIVLRLELRVV